MRSSFLVFVWCFISATVAVPSDRQSRIIGGQDATRRQFPYIAAIQTYGTTYGGGSILTPEWVVTSAFVFGQFIPHDCDVVAGLLTKGEVHSDIQFRVSERIVMHPEFDGEHNDIALVKVSSPFTINDAVKTIPLLCNPADLQMDVDVVTAGWGQTNGIGNWKQIMQYLQMPLISLQDCRGMVNGGSDVDENMLCVLPEEGRGSCILDYGNPLVQDGVLVGLKAGVFPGSCGTSAPNLFVNVHKYLPFIVATTYREFCEITPGPTRSTTPEPTSIRPTSVKPTGSSDTTPDSGITSNPSLAVFLTCLISLASCSNLF